MNQLYPLKFKPIIKEPIWGGNKLKKILAKENATELTGESWEISGVEDNISVVSNGFLEGNELNELIEVYMSDLIGEQVFKRFGCKFPLLFKFIDACNDLSIQVHPNDKIANERHNSFGKTEMWYVLQADTEAEIISGFKLEIDKATYLKHLAQKELLSILNKEKVKAGDVFFIPAGRIHAIGKGVLLAEIQQSSNITYRVYDYNRKDAKGNERELHTEFAADVIDYQLYGTSKTNYTKIKNQPIKLAECEYFTTNLLDLNMSLEREMFPYDSFIVYMCTEGQAEIVFRDNERELIQKGETVLIPAEISHYYIEPKEKVKLLEIYIADNKNEK